MTALNLILILLVQHLLGRGALRLICPIPSPTQRFALSFLLGLPLSTVVVLLLDVTGVRITLATFLGGTALLALLLHFRDLRQMSLPRLCMPPLKLRITPYTLLLLTIIAFPILVSIWRCYYLPITHRDALVGMDLVAKYAVEQGAFRSSVFSDPHLQGHLSNQPFYAPATALLQTIFRLSGLPFGKLWLSILNLSFLLFLSSKLRETLHPLLVGLLLVALVSVHEIYHLTFEVLTDFINAVLFSLSILFFHEFLLSTNTRKLLLSSLFMALACWSRSETIVFAALGALLLLRSSMSGAWRSRLLAISLFLVGPVAAFVIWNLLYVPLGLGGQPAHLELRPLISVSVFFRSLSEIAQLSLQANRYGHLLYLFALSLPLNFFLFRDRKQWDLLLWIVILYIGFSLLVWQVPAANIQFTVKRGLIKLFPMLVYGLAQMSLYKSLSRRIGDWESGAPSRG